MTSPEDFLIIGSGITGAAIARLLHDAGKRVLVLEQRPHPGGNVWDEVHESGIRYHLYGPHYFRTNSQQVWAFVNRFCAWRPWAASVSIQVGGDARAPILPWPLTSAELADFGKIEPPERIENFRDACLSKMPLVAYEMFVEPYNIKQWGVDPTKLLPSLAGRIDTAPSSGPRTLKTHEHQALPVGGYQAFIRGLLDGIPLELNHFFELKQTTSSQVVFTGSIDDLFDECHGELPYRCQERFLAHDTATKLRWPTPQLNLPSLTDVPIRGIEWKHLEPEGEGSLITWETPKPDGYEYPLPTFEAQLLYDKYRNMLPSLERVTVCGRLGEYKYLDMDVALARAMMVARRLLDG